MHVNFMPTTVARRSIAAASLVALTLFVPTGADARDAFQMQVMYGQKCLRLSLNEPFCACLHKVASSWFSDLIEREVFYDMVVEGVHPANNQLRPRLNEAAFMTRLPPADKAVTACRRANP